MKSKQKRVLLALAYSDALHVEPGFPVEQRSIFGVDGDPTDVAISLQWRDIEGCVWEADFTGQSFVEADITRNRITLHDSQGDRVCVSVHRLKPAKV